MVGQDRAGVAGVALRLDHAGEGLGDGGQLAVVECEQFVLEALLRFVVERLEDATRRLEAFAAEVQLAQVLQVDRTQFPRGAATRVVGEPGAVCRPDEVVASDDHESFSGMVF